MCCTVWSITPSNYIQLHLIIYNLSISRWSPRIMHVGIHHIDNDGDNYPFSLGSVGRVNGCCSSWQTSRSLKLLEFVERCTCFRIYRLTLPRPDHCLYSRRGERTNRNPSSQPAATHGCVSVWLALQNVGHKTELSWVWRGGFLNMAVSWKIKKIEGKK